MFEAINWHIWTHYSASVIAAFFASLVECVEALTIVLAVGMTRGWRSALVGAAVGLGLLVFFILTSGPLLSSISVPINWLQITLGTLLLLFGLKWLRKAVLRAAGVIPLHDEVRLYEKEIHQMGQIGKARKRWDWIAIVTSFKAVVLEGMEVVFIVIAVGAAETSLIPVSMGATAALFLVILLGLALHRPLTRVPENSLKFSVGVILSAFGTFWVGNGSGFKWPGDDLSIVWLIMSFLVVALFSVKIVRAINKQ